MLWLLVKIRLISLLKVTFGGKSNDKNKKGSPVKKILIGFLVVYLVGAVCLLTGVFFHSLIEIASSINMMWLYYSFAGLACLLFSFVGSVFMTQKEIYDAKDNEMLLSMPIPPSYILISRLILIFIMNLAFSLFIIIPAVVIHFAFVGASIYVVLAAILGTVFIGILSLTLSCIFGWLIALITSKIRRKNLVTTILMFAFFGGYMMIATNMQKYIEELLNNSVQIGDAIKKALPPIYYFGSSIGDGNILDMLWLFLWAIIPFLIVFYILSKSFIFIATNQKNTVKVKYEEKELKISSIRIALLRKELRRFFSLPLYMLNSALGVIMAVAFAIFFAVKGDGAIKMILEISEVGDMIYPIICGMICVCVVLTNTTAPSLSLEGSYFPILKSLPIRAKDIYYAKIMTNMVISTPFIFAYAVIFGFLVPASIVQKILLFILPFLFQFVVALLGMIMNVLFPKFEWVNHTVVIKQSLSVLLAMLIGVVLVLAMGASYIYLLKGNVSLELSMVIYTAVLGILATIGVWYINRKGEKRYNLM